MKNEPTHKLYVHGKFIPREFYKSISIESSQSYDGLSYDGSVLQQFIAVEYNNGKKVSYSSVEAEVVIYKTPAITAGLIN